MHHLINNSFISYNRIRKVYLIEANGWDLLYSIYSQRESLVSDYAKNIIKVESNNYDLNIRVNEQIPSNKETVRQYHLYIITMGLTLSTLNTNWVSLSMIINTLSVINRFSYNFG